MNFGKDHNGAMECIFDIFITLSSERRADHLNSIYEKCRIRGTAISLYTHYTIGVFVNDFCKVVGLEMLSLTIKNVVDLLHPIDDDKIKALIEI